MFDAPIQPPSQSVKVLLDGQPITVPNERRSPGAIRVFLEALAMENHRVLCSFNVAGETGHPAKKVHSRGVAFAYPAKNAGLHITARTVSLNEMPARMLETALQETAHARAAVEAAVTLVLINDGAVARELWWDLARTLKEPLLTLSLLPETIYQQPAGCASLQQLRQWQLQQLAAILRDVDEACWQPETDALSHALEYRALPWLNKLHETIRLWHQTVLVGLRLPAAQKPEAAPSSFANS